MRNDLGVHAVEGRGRKQDGQREESSHDAGPVTAWAPHPPWAALELVWPMRVVSGWAKVAGPFYARIGD